MGVSPTPSPFYIRNGIFKRLRSPRIDFAAYVAWACIFKLLWSWGIDSQKSIPPAYIAWRGRYDNPIPTRFLTILDCYNIPAWTLDRYLKTTLTVFPPTQIFASWFQSSFLQTVEELYCKRPIQCLAPPKYWPTPPPPHRPGNVYPPPVVRGEDRLAVWRGGGGSIVRKTPDTALSSIYVSTLCFKLYIQATQYFCLLI